MNDLKIGAQQLTTSSTGLPINWLEILRLDVVALCAAAAAAAALAAIFLPRLDIV